jgi:hypothetical protein
LRKLYQVAADPAAARHHQLRVINESGEDYLYPEEYFVPVQLPEATGMRRLEGVRARFCARETSAKILSAVGERI